jgi:hypothetical protein
MASAPQSRQFLPGQGNIYRLGRLSLAFKTCAADNGGAYSLLEAIEPPGSGADLHYLCTSEDLVDVVR